MQITKPEEGIKVVVKVNKSKYTVCAANTGPTIRPLTSVALPF